MLHRQAEIHCDISFNYQRTRASSLPACLPTYLATYYRCLPTDVGKMQVDPFPTVTGICGKLSTSPSTEALVGCSRHTDVQDRLCKGPEREP